MRLKLTGFSWVLILCSFNSFAKNDSLHSHTIWFSTTTSTALNHSTIALAGGHYRRGIHYAHTALKNDLGETDQLIAHHNLCLAYLQMDKERLSEKHCRKMNVMVDPGLFVQSERGANYIVRTNSREGTSPESLSLVIINNIYINYELPALAW